MFYNSKIKGSNSWDFSVPSRTSPQLLRAVHQKQIPFLFHSHGITFL